MWESYRKVVEMLFFQAFTLVIFQSECKIDFESILQIANQSVF